MSDVSEHPGCRECRNYSLRGPEYCAFCETDDLHQQLATLTQERDALREDNQRLTNAMQVAASTAGRHWLETQLMLADVLNGEKCPINYRDMFPNLTPSGEVGKGGEV